MADDELQDLSQELIRLKQSNDYRLIRDKFDGRFDRITTEILPKCRESRLSRQEKSAIDHVSYLELFISRHLTDEHKSKEDETSIGSYFRRQFFPRRKITVLRDLVEYIRDEASDEFDDEILSYVTRMIDARTLIYRLYWDQLAPAPQDLHDELFKCFTHTKTKHCLDQIIFSSTNRQLSQDYQRFLLGCCTFEVALYKDDKSQFNKETDAKLIYRLAKFVRVILSKTRFPDDELDVYSLRGIFAILINKVPTEAWLMIINKALANPDDQAAQKQNPFNEELFSLIIFKLLGSQKLQKDTLESASNDSALLVDVALVFLEKWCFTAITNDQDDVDDLERRSSIRERPNEVIEFLRSSSSDHHTHLDKTKIILHYIDAKHGRIRLMAFAVLANMMNSNDFEDFRKSKPNLARDLVDLLVQFIRKAHKSTPLRQYRGIPFELLLRYLYRFLIQDFVKKETIEYLTDFIDYATRQEIMALKIILRLTTNPELKDRLNIAVMKQFLEVNAPDIYYSAPQYQKIIAAIRQNLKPDPPKAKVEASVSSLRQAFISYCQSDMGLRKKFVEELKKQNLFDCVWIDKEHMEGDMNETIPAAIRSSTVVFILLSQLYCDSNVCRKELYFATSMKISIVPIILHKSFKIDTYDWVKFNVGYLQYYRFDVEGQLDKLFQDLANKSDATPPKPKKNEKNPPSPPTARIYHGKPVSQWTSMDIRHWCEDNKFEHWLKHLENYDGPCLLQLYGNLQNDSLLNSFFLNSGLNMMEITRFKYQLDQLVRWQTSIRGFQQRHRQYSNKRSNK